MHLNGASNHRCASYSCRICLKLYKSSFCTISFSFSQLILQVYINITSSIGMCIILSIPSINSSLNKYEVDKLLLLLRNLFHDYY